MIRNFRIIALFAALALLTQKALAQDSKAAKATREKLKQVIDEFEAKDIGTKNFFEDVNREIEKSIKFEVDGTTGISNNTKLSYKGKKVTVEKLLNDISDANGFGWYVYSNESNNKKDGSIIIRKSEKGKERGYEAGKEPKKSSSIYMHPREGYAQRELRSTLSARHREAIETYFRNLNDPVPDAIFARAAMGR